MKPGQWRGQPTGQQNPSWLRQLRTWAGWGVIYLFAIYLSLGASPAWAAESAPDLNTRIDQAAQLFSEAFAATQKADFATAETLWSQIIELVPENPAAWSNRGNARVSQGKLEAGVSDYDQAIVLAPEQPDSYLNRGTAREALGQWQAAIDDYNHVLVLDPQDPAAYNNRGNAQAGQGNWQAALADYHRAFELAPDYAFARANYALAVYQIGKEVEAIKAMQDLVRRYPNFVDMRASLTAALWAQGKRGEAESYWAGVVGLDKRYQDLEWVAKVRRWPPTLVANLANFLQLR